MVFSPPTGTRLSSPNHEGGDGGGGDSRLPSPPLGVGVWFPHSHALVAEGQALPLSLC